MALEKVVNFIIVEEDIRRKIFQNSNKKEFQISKLNTVQSHYFQIKS